MYTKHNREKTGIGERKHTTSMLSRIKSHGLNGIGGFAVQVETDIANGLPGFEIVGLPDAAVK